MLRGNERARKKEESYRVERKKEKAEEEWKNSEPRAWTEEERPSDILRDRTIEPLSMNA